MQKGFHEPDSVVVFTTNRTTYVWHYNLEVNCGFDSIAVTGHFSGDTIIVTERDNPNKTANCECDVDNSFRINNIPKGGCYLIIYDSRDRIVAKCALVSSTTTSVVFRTPAELPEDGQYKVVIQTRNGESDDEYTVATLVRNVTVEAAA